MKKYLLILIILLSPFLVLAKSNENNLDSIKKGIMNKLDLEKEFSVEKSSGASAIQNMKYTKKYIFFTQSKYGGDANGENTIIVLDRETKKKIKELKYNIGHGNDMTYNNRTREVMFLKSLTDDVEIICFDYDTLEHTRDIKVEGITKAYGLSYNIDNNSYYISTSNRGYILDGLFQIISSFSTNTNKTVQSFAYYKGFLYYSNYEAGFANGYQKNYDGSFNPFDSIIYVFDINGKVVKGFYAPPLNGEPTELEGMSFDEDGTAHFVFNNWNTSKGDVYKYTGDLLPLKQEMTKKETVVLNDFNDMAINNTYIYIISLILLCLVGATIIFVGNRKIKV
jgi:hypothetical protein